MEHLGLYSENNVPHGAIKVDSGAKCDIIEVMDDG